MERDICLLVKWIFTVNFRIGKTFPVKLTMGEEGPSRNFFTKELGTIGVLRHKTSGKTRLIIWKQKPKIVISVYIKKRRDLPSMFFCSLCRTSRHRRRWRFTTELECTSWKSTESECDGVVRKSTGFFFNLNFFLLKGVHSFRIL